MARLPVYEQQVSALGPLGPGPVEGGDSPVGRAMEQIGALMEQQREDSAALEASGILAEARTRWAVMAEEARRAAPPGAAGLSDQLRRKVEGDRNELLKRARTVRSRQWLEERLTSLAAGVDEGAKLYEIDEGVRARAATVESNVQKLIPGVEADPSQYQDALDEQLSIVRAMGAGPEITEKAAASVREALAQAAVTGWLRTDPQRMAEEFAKPESAIAAIRDLAPEARARLAEQARGDASDAKVDGKAASVLAAYEYSFRNGVKALRAQLADPGLTADEREALQVRVRQQVGLLADRRQQENVDRLAELERLQAAGDPRAERLGAQLYDRGALTELQYAGVVGAAAAERRRQAEARSAGTSVQAAIVSGVPLDPKDEKARRAVDAYFGETMRGAAPGTPLYNQGAAEIARTVNVVPDQAVSWGRANLFGGAPEAAIAAADLFTRLEDANPTAFGMLDEKTRALAEQVTVAVRAGTPPAAAVEQARQNVQRPAAEMKVLQEQYRTDKIARGNVRALARLLDSDERFDTELLRGAPDAPAAMAGEFEEQVARYYSLTGGNAEKARELAFRDLARKWGRTEVNGRPQLMPYAPEAMYPGLTPEIVRKDLAQTLAEAGAQVRRLDPLTGAAAPAAVDAASVQLIPFADTARTQGRRWHLGVRDEYGAPDVLRDANNAPLVYELPLDEKRYRELAGEQFEADKARLREKRQWRRQVRESIMDGLDRGMP